MRRAWRVGLIIFGSIAALSVVAFIAGFAYLALVICHEPNWGNKPFTVQEWRAAGRDTRYLYVYDLMNSKRLDGLSVEQVKAMLGPPNSEHREHRERLTYTLKPSCIIDDWYLDIEFENGKLKTYDIRPS